MKTRRAQVYKNPQFREQVRVLGKNEAIFETYDIGGSSQRGVYRELRFMDMSKPSQRALMLHHINRLASLPATHSGVLTDLEQIIVEDLDEIAVGQKPQVVFVTGRNVERLKERQHNAGLIHGGTFLVPSQETESVIRTYKDSWWESMDTVQQMVNSRNMIDRTVVAPSVRTTLPEDIDPSQLIYFSDMWESMFATPPPPWNGKQGWYSKKYFIRGIKKAQFGIYPREIETRFPEWDAMNAPFALGGLLASQGNIIVVDSLDEHGSESNGTAIKTLIAGISAATNFARTDVRGNTANIAYENPQLKTITDIYANPQQLMDLVRSSGRYQSWYSE